MGQKINPIAFRTGNSRFSDFSWYSNTNYSKLIYQTILFQSYINNICKSLLYASGRFFINYFPKKRNIFFCYSKFDNNNQIKTTLNPKNFNLNCYDKYKISHSILKKCFAAYANHKNLIVLFLLIATKL